MQPGGYEPVATSAGADDVASDNEEHITSSKASFEDAPQEQPPANSNSDNSHPSEDKAPSERSKPGSQKAPSRQPSVEESRQQEQPPGEQSTVPVTSGSRAGSQQGSRTGSQQGSRRGSNEAAVPGVADAPADAATRDRAPGDEHQAFRDSTITAVSESTAQMLGRDGAPKTTSTDPSAPGVLAGTTPGDRAVGDDDDDDDELQPLTKYVDWKEHISISIGPFIILFFDLALPVCIYYSWLRAQRNRRRAACQGAYDAGVECGLPPVETVESRILGFAIIAFGFGEVYILVVRVYRLIARFDECAPLLSKAWWEFDATTWVYTLGLIAALVPFVCSTTVYEPDVVEWLYLYSPGFMFMVLDAIAFMTLIPIRMPFKINSDPAGERLKPIVYYAAEDFFAVDGAQNREFRRRYVERYKKSMMFRKMILELTLFWIGGCTCYLGYVAAIIWNVEFERAFGTSLGVLFGWIIIWGVTARFWIEWAIKREQKWWKENKAEREAAKIQ